jgi:hypothetical protein
MISTKAVNISNITNINSMNGSPYWLKRSIKLYQVY